MRKSVTAKLISAFVFALWIVHSLFYLNPKAQASTHLLWLHSPICVGPGRKPRRPVFSKKAQILAKRAMSSDIHHPTTGSTSSFFLKYGNINIDEQNGNVGHENISTTSLPLPLIREEQLSVNGERMYAKY